MQRIQYVVRIMCACEHLHTIPQQWCAKQKGLQVQMLTPFE